MKTPATRRNRRQAGRESRLRAAIRALVRRFQISERADVSCCGMTVAQAAMLEALRLEGDQRLGDLSRQLGVSASTLSRNFSRLEERGWVERVPDPGDGRASIARLTARGRAAAGEVERQEVAFAGEILRRLPGGERERAVAGLEALLVAVRQASEHCCGSAFDHLMAEFPRCESDEGVGP